MLRLTFACALQTQVFETLPKDRWYTTIVDKNALRVLSSHMKLSDLLEYNVSVVDPLEISRKPAKDAVYLISPLAASMKRVLEDFHGPKPLYESVRLFFTSKATEDVLDMLKSCAPLVKRLQALKEVLPTLQLPHAFELNQYSCHCQVLLGSPQVCNWRCRCTPSLRMLMREPS